MKVGQIGPTFIFPGKTVTFLLVESLVTSSILKMRKSHKKLAPAYAYCRYLTYFVRTSVYLVLSSDIFKTLFNLY